MAGRASCRDMDGIVTLVVVVMLVVFVRLHREASSRAQQKMPSGGGDFEDACAQLFRHEGRAS